MWIPHRNFSHYSILKSISKPDAIISRCVDLGLTAFSLTDHSLNGFIPLLKAKKKYIENCKDENKKKVAGNLKINVGLQFGRATLIAKNLDGYKSLIKLYSDPSDVNQVKQDSLIMINDFALEFFEENLNKAMLSTSYEECKSLVKPGWDKRVEQAVDWVLRAINDLYFGVQLIDKKTNPINEVLAKGLRYLAKDKCVAIAESYYCNQNESKDQWISLCTKMKTTIPKVKEELIKVENIELAKFFKSNGYYIRSEKDLIMGSMARTLAGHTQNELDNSVEIQELIEEFDITNKPVIPKFPCPGTWTSDDYLTELCREGWRSRVIEKIPKEKHKEYEDRIKHELQVLKGAGLSDYFLIVHDLVNYCKNNNIFVGPGRGSAAGCLTSYLLGCTAIDPIEFGLIFERFYNAGRNTKDRVANPDFDLDVQGEHTETLINYAINKYGKDRVGYIGTFGRSMGRGILTEVLTRHAVVSPAEIKKITKILPDEAAIADDLNEMKEEEGQSSIIQWSLENQANQLRDYCYLDEKGELQGPHAQYFKQAIRLEGIIKSEGMHAAGIVIWPDELTNNFPVRENDGCTVISYDMNTIEAVGGVKMDILSLWILDRMTKAEKLINSTKISEL